MRAHPVYLKKKSCIRETLNLSTDADTMTIIMKFFQTFISLLFRGG